MPTVDKICESFTHNPLTQAQGNYTLLYLIGIHKECITNMIKFECDFVGGQHGCTCIAMGKKQYSLHSHIAFTPPIKLVRSPAYHINPTHDNIDAADQQYHNNLHGYHLVNKINSSLKKISVAAINEHWIKGAKDMVMGYVNKYFRELMDWIYLWYGHITPRDLI